ncbi:tellurite resistance TerB family protein [Alteromonas gilva]|uniref:TerB family tellurite resistance protein n=1 Tax=Alteromonas gilva TaxID=2987522 RepID=A0ABT5L4X3_9ALTE|nr:TerB family tellurite resistance protein [Alteromonas gilva]MDC8831536.1 TerB family tellurite resistance protein [Alteromonas gilva]
MLKSIVAMIKGSPSEPPNPHQLEIATAALFAEVVKADNQADERELSALKQIINEHFELSDEELENVVSVADARSDEAVDLVQFTQALNEGMSAENKEKIMLGLWQVAYADSTLDPHEEHLIRKIADLLYIPHSRFIKTKLTAQSKP